ncbi:MULTISPECIES: FecR family protein [unclassified Delftia]|uniref:FecR family protein n=1 Tax=unclassified Delftia TaxID=2613839 RepID=UPI00068DA023|nr:MULTISPECIES: FecR domain-containing protein [unclassified Delftia]MDC2862334.1 FecR domain-containing protein [Delftia sp. DT-2]
MTDAPRPASLPEGLSAQALIDVHETAAEWFMRRSEPGWTGAEERALEGWLAQAPLHRETFEGMSLIGHDLHQIPLAKSPSWRMVARNRAAVTAVPAAPPASLPRAAGLAGAASLSSPSRGRRNWASAAACACVVLLAGGGYGWHRWDNTASFQLDVATGHGETRAIELPDGSSVTLNIDSSLQVRFYPGRREVLLDRGEGFFQVAADTRRPFTVDSGVSQVKVVGTAFNVRAVPPQIVVKVLEGKVEVRPDRHASQGQVLRLGSGSGLSIDPSTGQTRSMHAAAATVGDWRTGQIQFQRAPLGDVVLELSRYLGQPVVLVNQDLARQPVSGVLSTASPKLFLQALPELLPLRVQQTADGGWRISRH